MCHDQVVVIRRQRQIAEIGLNEINWSGARSLPGERNHSCARLDAIDLRAGVKPDEIGKKTPIPLPCDEDAAGRLDLPNECKSRRLQLRTKSKRLEPAIVRRDAIEAHRIEKSSANSGVSRTRSAKAVRLSRARWCATLSLTSRSALAARQSQSGKAKRQKRAQASAARAMP